MFWKDILDVFDKDLEILSYFVKKVIPIHLLLNTAITRLQFIIIIVLFDAEFESSYSIKEKGLNLLDFKIVIFYN